MPMAGCHKSRGKYIVTEINTYIPIDKIDNGGGVSDKEREYAERLGLEVKEKCGPAAVEGIENEIQKMLDKGVSPRERYNRIIERCKAYLGDTEA